jgi:hypothetical protein
MNEDRLRSLYNEALERRARTEQPCAVPLESMLEVLERRGPEETRLRVLRDILRSPSCLKEFELLRAVVRANQAERARRVPPLIWRWAAGIALIVGAGLAVRFWPPREEPLRGAGVAVTLLTPSESAQLTSSPAFAWRPATGVLEYRLEVLSDSGAVLYSATIHDTMAALPPDLLLPGHTYEWRVVASLSSGRSVPSAPRRFTLVP